MLPKIRSFVTEQSNNKIILTLIKPQKMMEEIVVEKSFNNDAIKANISFTTKEEDFCKKYLRVA